MNMQTTLEDVLKDELMGDIVFESGDPVKVYKTIAGLPNLGKTYFMNGSEVQKKNSWAQTQMTNKYGAEIYGISAQTTSKTQTPETPNSLIQCRVNLLMRLPQKGFVKEAKSKASDAFRQTLNDIDNAVHGKVNSTEKQKFTDITKKFAFDEPTSRSNNDDSYVELMNLLKKDPWKSLASSDKEVKNAFAAAKKAWDTWKKDRGDASDKGGGNDIDKGAWDNTDNNGWMPYQTFRIDIVTKFDDEWYKRNYKSGLLNKALLAIRTDMHSHNSEEAGKLDKMNNHVYTQDEMLDEDRRRLDKIRWKMTNKVAKDFIELFMGWSRKKQVYSDDHEPVEEELQRDEAFGKQMAKKALSNRGFLSRLKQKLFNGQQNSGSITVAFQMADPNDGWEEIERKPAEEPIDPNDIDVGEEEPGEPEDPFTECFDAMDDNRANIVRAVCESGKGIDTLVDDCILG